MQTLTILSATLLELILQSIMDISLLIIQNIVLLDLEHPHGLLLVKRIIRIQCLGFIVISMMSRRPNYLIIIIVIIIIIIIIAVAITTSNITLNILNSNLLTIVLIL